MTACADFMGWPAATLLIVCVLAWTLLILAAAGVNR